MGRTKLNSTYKNSTTKINNISGFTFIEILIALIILGSATTIIFSLQSANVSATVRDSQAQKAILIARSIMSQIESIEETIENTNKNGTAFTILDSLNAPVPPNMGMRELETFTANLVIEYWNVPNIEEIPKSSLRRVLLTVAWGDTDRDKVEFYYFIPKEPEA